MKAESRSFAMSGAEPSLEVDQKTTVVAFHDVGKTFAGGVEAVRNINLQVGQGEFITLVGPSGCGKSTLLNMAAGLFQPTTGKVYYRNQAVTTINRRVGYMTQVDHLLPWRTIAGNIAIPLEIAGRSRKEIASEIDRLISLVGLTGFHNAYPSQLSGGMRKRAALARLFAYDPETLLMDEPFGALDAQLRLMLQIELKRLCRTLKKTVLFVTHDVDEAIGLADRCVVFSERPGTIRRVIEVDLPQDRDIKTLRFDSSYVEQCAELWRILTPAIEAQASQGEGFSR
jgi:NitT/TauT family transport system ATP-binding protein